MIGMHFGAGYQILREIARGLVAQVYLASDGREVRAVKVFPIDRRDGAGRELRFGGGLSHPNLNPIEGRIELAGRPAVVMPFVPGTRLGRWLSSATPMARLAAIDGLLAGLGHLHERGIVHRDVKPENVLVTPEGRAVLIDYDLAMDAHDRQDRRTLAGTVAYLSPEQTRGDPAEPASDLYAAGVLLYRALSDDLPFEGDVHDVLEGHRSGEPRPLSAIDAALAPYDALVLRLLAKRPEDRPRDAEEVRSALRRIPPRTLG